MDEEIKTYFPFPPKFEPKVGEVFKIDSVQQVDGGDVFFVAVKNETENIGCVKCVLLNFVPCHSLQCDKKTRSDNTTIHVEFFSGVKPSEQKI